MINSLKQPKISDTLTYFAFNKFCCSIRHNNLKSAQNGAHKKKKSLGLISSPAARLFGWKW